MKTIYLIGIGIILLAINATAETGIASWYSVASQKGHHTASGEKLNDNALTCAHRTHKFGTMLKVRCLVSGKSVVVRVNDRGPYIKGRVIDLTREGARRIGIIKKGITKVEISKQ